MQITHFEPLARLLTDQLGMARAEALLGRLELPRELPLGPPGSVHRATLAMALSALLFDDVLRRVPGAAAYAEDRRLAGRRLLLDHGALRTFDAGTGALPAGRAAFARILEPLGYERRESYDLVRLSMTGHAYTHRDAPESIAQYFVSELHVERFDAAFGQAVEEVGGASRDPLSAGAKSLLARLDAEGRIGHEAAARLLPELVGCFDRQHAAPRLADYETLLAQSPEAAWIATEGNAFNHATDRVDDVYAVAQEQHDLGREIKDRVEVSRSGRVLQTALHAARVQRAFRDGEGRVVLREVPGSFHEFITRRRTDEGVLDLSFDAGNATGIFGMTSASLAG